MFALSKLFNTRPADARSPLLRAALGEKITHRSLPTKVVPRQAVEAPAKAVAPAPQAARPPRPAATSVVRSAFTVFEPHVNPVSGLPMIKGAMVDVAGNPYGMDLDDRLLGF
jgi:hypothetical protein